MKPSNDREAITLILKGLAEHDIKPTAVDTGDGQVKTLSVKAAIEEATSGDEAYVFLSLPEHMGRTNSFIYFVLGNEPFEVAADYGIAISDYIDPIVTPWDQ